jgi:peptide-methionine (R)-S-oxide reductase
MKRLIGLIVLGVAGLAGCNEQEPVARPDLPGTSASGATDAPTTAPAGMQIKKTKAEWKAILSPETYHIMFEAGTERPFGNAYYNNHESGLYVSAATGAPLFSSKDKYDSGTGWPSFTKPIDDRAVIVREDADGSGRFEVIDAGSGGHLGHVFNDGPAPTGKRYCMNSAALKFIPEAGK